jgi:hypothetical protein
MPGQASADYTYTLHPDTQLTLHSQRMTRYLDDGSLAHLALGPIAQELQDCRDAMFELRETGRADWFTAAGGERFYHLEGEALRIRPDLYFHPAPTVLDADLQLAFRDRHDLSERRIPLDSNSFQFLGEMLSALRPSRRQPNVPPDFLQHLASQKVIRRTLRRRLRRRQGFRISLVGHACLLAESSRARVIFDPLVNTRHRPKLNRMQIFEEPLAGVFISHPHWDHLNLDTLFLIDRATPIYVPKPRSGVSIVNLDMAQICRDFGFTHVRALEPWETVDIEDIRVTPLPFYGEGSGPEGRQDWLTFHLALGKKSALAFVDACNDFFGSMDDVAEEVRRRLGKVDFFFSPFSNFKFQISQFHRRPFFLSRELEQFTGSAEDALRWARLCGARKLVPYAAFLFDEADYADSNSRSPSQFDGLEDLTRLAAASPRSPLSMLTPARAFYWQVGQEEREAPLFSEAISTRRRASLRMS